MLLEGRLMMGSPSGPRVSGMIASGPASPIRPVSPRIGKLTGPETTPPVAKGITLPCVNAPPCAKGISPPNIPASPPASIPPSCWVTGFTAAL